jgi:threonine/homoserine/homoserine lactone efflux protein
VDWGSWRGKRILVIMLTELVAFVPVAAVVICTPGPDTALNIRNAVAGGRTAGILTAAGVAIGQGVWTVAASLGLTSLLRASAPAFLALKVAGAAYLIILGIQSLRAARARRGHDAVASAPRQPMRPVRALRQGLVNDLGNPKMAGFFVGLLPQFAGTGRGSLVAFLGFGFLFCLLTFGWLTVYSLVVARARAVFDRPRIRRGLDALTGCVLIGLGVRLAAEQR